jgi:hypothetical protein
MGGVLGRPDNIAATEDSGKACRLSLNRPISLRGRKMEKIRFLYSFMAKGSDGKQYNINVFSSYSESNTSSGFVSTPGQKLLRTREGNHINYKSKGIYELHTPSETIELTSEDPKAP